MQDVNGSYVYCINTDNIIKKVLIKTGLNTPNGDWIRDSGLKAGDNVIISDLMKLRQGMSVIPNYIKVQH